MSFQMHTLSGFVGSDPQQRTVQVNGQERQVVNLSVAVNDNRRKDAPPTWYRVAVWGGLANVVAQYVGKSDYVVISGSNLRVSTWLDQQGQPRATLELTAASVDFSANRRRNERPVDDKVTQGDDIPF